MNKTSGVRVASALYAVSALCLVLAFSCSRGDGSEVTNYSFARVDEVVVTHVDLHLDVDFDTQRIRGTATFNLEHRKKSKRLWLDTWALSISDVRLDAADGPAAEWSLGDSTALIGRALSVAITPETRRVVVTYETGTDARGVQWLDKEQTQGKRQPFLYTQSQAIHARSWLPCQDTPEVRTTYSARVRVPRGMLALMSATNPRFKNDDGIYEFTMRQPIPAYLFALAAGDVEYRAVSDRCGVYAETELVDNALWEFIDMERMTQTAESLYGPYRWEQFDVLVLPPSFPYGGMENPRLTFATPVLVAGDRSLVSTIAHELAHSWSGNLVTNATWDDFWLNEGFTTYFERRIMEALYGRSVSEMHALLGRQGLDEEVVEEGPNSRDTALYIELNGRDPDVELGTAPYEKGYLFLRLLEETYGREKFDVFLRGYFDAHAFQTMTTEKFLTYLDAQLIGADRQTRDGLRLNEWVFEPGVPTNVPKPQSARFEFAAQQAAAFNGGARAADLDTKEWTSAEWQRFIETLARDLPRARMDDLAKTFDFTKANGEVQRSWYLLVVQADYQPNYGAMDSFLKRIGRRWLIRPIYQKLAETPDGLAHARQVYRQARPGYHSITRQTIDQVLGWKETP